MGQPVTLADVRALIAARLLQSNRPDDAVIGSITLRPHQITAVARLRASMEEFGGALLCDQVGMGKTFVALALCGKQGLRVVAPAVLKEMWIKSAQSAGKSIEFTSTESLSRIGRDARGALAPLSDQPLLIVDEAHHFRNPSTQRYASLARLASGRRVLMMSATPVHNVRRDLIALIAIFLGSAASSLKASELGRLIVRREQDSLSGMSELPEVLRPEWRDLAHDDDVPRLLLDLPPPLPPRDGGDGGALVVHSLLRQWASSDAALEGALRRRLHRAIGLMAALESGTYPSTSELSAWNSAEDSVQLAFAALVATGSGTAAELLPVVRRHSESVAALLQRVKANASTDHQRVDVIRAIRRKHNAVSVVAFSQYADTIDALFRALASDGCVAALTGNSARVAGGRISRAEAIRRFAPRASGASAPSAAESVTLLLTTDLLSEGVNLQDAGVVIHLDLPWTPARMEQRLGRVARMGSSHARIFSYVIRPPASSETLIRLEHVLRDKMRSAGVVVDAFPSLGFSVSIEATGGQSTPRMSEAIRAIVEEWKVSVPINGEEVPLVAAVDAPFDGFLALCEANGQPTLLIKDREGVTDDPARIVAAIRVCDGRAIPVSPDVRHAAIEGIRRHSHAIESTGGAASIHANVKRAALRRVAGIVSRARPHERSRVAALGRLARSSILARMGADRELQLESLSGSELSDEGWMRSVSRLSNEERAEDNHRVLLALILFQVGDTKALQRQGNGAESELNDL